MTLPGIRDTPRPAYVVRKNKPELIVTPGTDVSAPKLEVYALEGTQATLKASIPRYSSQEIGSVRALVSDGKLFVTWLDIDESSATVRAAVLPEP